MTMVRGLKPLFQALPAALAGFLRRPGRSVGRRAEEVGPPGFRWLYGRRGSPLRRALVLGALVLAALAAWVRFGPLPEGFLEPAPHRSARVVDRRGRLLYEALSEREARSAWLGPGELPPVLVQATLAAEDHRFYRHPGLDPLALARAAWHDLRALRVVEGGSTLTQQAVKLLTARRRTLGGKLREMVLALRVEHRLAKGEILALYLNLAPYGNQYAGARAAALGYFGTPVSNLTPAQAAFLAGLPQSPTAFDPYRRLPAAVARQREVLSRMHRLGYLDGASYQRAREERLVFRRVGRPFEAPHFVQKVLAEAGESPPGALRTTLDLDLQREVEGILSVQRPYLSAHGANNAAVVVLDNARGEWLAWEGSGDFFDPAHGGAIDGAATPRQPGSALKPFTYALAFEKGYTPASVLPDVPSHFPTAEPGIAYSPRNYDGAFRGPLRARKALGGSVNVPAVWLLSKVGVADLLDVLRGCGLTSLDRTADYYGYGLTLGDAEVRLDELAAAYAVLARGGRTLRPRSLLPPGGAPEPGGPEGRGVRRAFSAEAAFYVTDILSDPEARAFIFGRGGSLDLPFPVAVKTGTSQAYRDNWTLGYTREVTVGVWVGNFDRSPLVGSSGITGAGPIFNAVMQAAQTRVLGRFPGPADPPLAQPPPGVEPVSLCALSGLRAGPACPSTVVERLAPEGVPPPCSWHAGSAAGSEVAWPAEYQGWARARGRAGGAEERAPSAASSRPRSAGPRSPEGFAVSNPPEGAIYLLDPTLRAEFQALPLRVAAGGPSREVVWSVDGREVGRCRSDQALEWPLVRGDHRVEVRDGTGLRSVATFRVK